MKHRLNSFDKELLKEECSLHSFIKHGSTYFRLCNEDILQAISFNYEPSFAHYSLNIGLMSMYGSPSAEYFYSKSSLPRYSICCINNQANAVSLSAIKGLVEVKIISAHEQIEILSLKGFDWLNTINSQGSLLEALCYLDQMTYKATIWNDLYKLAPCLYLKDFYKANLIISSILDQHLGPDSFSQPPWSEVDYTIFIDKFPTLNNELLTIYHWIQNKDEQAIFDFLSKNKEENHRYGYYL